MITSLTFCLFLRFYFPSTFYRAGDDRGQTFIWDVRDPSVPLRSMVVGRISPLHTRLPSSSVPRSLHWIQPNRVIFIDNDTGEGFRMYPYVRKTPGTVQRTSAINQEDRRKEWIPKLGSMYDEVVVTDTASRLTAGLVTMDWNVVQAPAAAKRMGIMYWNPWVLVGHSCGALLRMNSNLKYHYNEDINEWDVQHGNRRNQIEFSVQKILGGSPFLLRCMLNSSSSSSSSSSSAVFSELTLHEHAPRGTNYNLSNNANVPIDAVAVHLLSSSCKTSVISCALRCGVVVIMLTNGDGEAEAK